MRRKLICLMLCLLALMTLAFTGCSGEAEETGEEEKQQSARTPVTVNMWLVSEKEVDAETEALVEEAFNKLTQAKFTTKVDLIFLTEDEYFDVLDENLAAAAQYKLNNTTTFLPVIGDAEETTEAVETTVETVTNELGQHLLKYPDAEEGQMDIIFLSGEDLLERYVSEGKLLSLEEKLNSSDAKVLRDCIYPSALKQIRISNGSSSQAYSIPNNNVIGDYTYMLVNKEMADKYYIDLTEIETFADCAALIADIGNNESIAPVLAYTDPVNMQYWLDFAAEEKTTAPFTFAIGSTEVNAFGANKKLLVAPYATGDTVMVPLQVFAEALGARYNWNVKSATATLTYGSRKVAFVSGEKVATVNNEEYALSQAAFFDEENAVFMAPIDFVTDILCASVAFDEASDKYVITKNDYSMSILASYIGANDAYGDRMEMVSAFDIPEFTEHMVLMSQCAENGWFAEDPENTEDFGVAILSGSYDTMAQYADKYEIKILSYPVLDEADVYDSMFAVTNYTVNIDRALEILTLMYTNTEAKNILQYGVEGVHYEFDDEGQFVVISDKYCMDNNKLGNAFLAYTDDKVDPETWADAKSNNLPASVWSDEIAANLESRVYAFYGLDDAWSSVGANHITEITKLSNIYMDRMEACKTSVELAEFFKTASAELAEYVYFQTVIGNPPEADPDATDGEEEEEDLSTPFAVFSAWGEPIWPEKVEVTVAVTEAVATSEVPEVLETTAVVE
ncbi:MAG: hypothetical protein E7598_06445 [Ruminococcaceae bacterium]|nr:hypothetical protein [Oscillospiraceae bacterium]